MNYWILFIVSFAASVISIYFLRKFAIRYNLYDKPGQNKIHRKPIPCLGGLGIFFGFVIGLIFAQVLDKIPIYQVVGIILGGIIILSLGLWDDLRWKEKGRPFLKLFCQFLAGILIVFILIKAGIDLGFPINSILAILLAVFYIVGVINAVNVNDGMDGLAGGIVGISLVGFIILSFLNSNLFVFIISGILLSSILGFLIYNWQPASIFMGDGGSHFLGFVLAILAIISTGHSLYNFRQFIGPLLIIGFPIVDIGWVVIVRLIKGKSPFVEDRNHSYDQIHLKLGFSTSKTVLICYSFQIILVMAGILIYSL